MKKEVKYVLALLMLVIVVETSKFAINKFGLFKEFFNPELNIENLNTPNYSIDNHDIEIVVNLSGDLFIKEKIEYDIKEKTDKVYRYYTVKRNELEGKLVYQPQFLGITKITCNGKEVKENIVYGNALLLNQDKAIGKKVYEIEYVLGDAVEKCNNVSEFFCNLNLGAFIKDDNDVDILIKAENSGKMIDARILVGSGDNNFTVSVEDGVIKAHTDKLTPDVDVWLNVKLENSCVPNTERIMLEERKLKF